CQSVAIWVGKTVTYLLICNVFKELVVCLSLAACGSAKVGAKINLFIFNFQMFLKVFLSFFGTFPVALQDYCLD
ncbi:MAG: hypothetical protein LLG05_18545, partial [Porphyromonadaceae bacterium]|nr:hypothetical protein [Porphyromonadaceae bacterium]